MRSKSIADRLCAGTGELIVEALSYAHWPSFSTVKLGTSLIATILGVMTGSTAISILGGVTLAIGLTASAIDVWCDAFYGRKFNRRIRK
jgi:hypothetical protein